MKPCMVGAEGTKNVWFWWINPRSLEKALSEKELHQIADFSSLLKLFLKNVEEILFGQIFLSAHTT